MDMACAFGRPQGASFGVPVGTILTRNVYLLTIALPAMLSIMWSSIGFGVSCTIGLVFAICRAWKSANLDPIEVLRYE
jgi:ABC-type antimicrobial peptide transport system permease subunit